MGELVVTEFLSLDGVMQDPGGTGEYDRGGWAFKFDRGPEGDKFKFDELMGSDAQLLGRVTYDGFAKPDVIAPAVNLFSDAAPNSALVKGTPAEWQLPVNDGASLIALSGTSMGAAVATGVVAHNVCSKTFVSGLDPQMVFAEEELESADPGASFDVI